MDIKSIDLYNFLSHKSTSLILDDRRPYLFIGPNGAGKSSLIKDAVTFALFGESRVKGAGDELIHNKENACKVKLIVESNNTKYIIQRLRERNKKTTLEFFKIDDGVIKDLTNMTMTLTQKDIEQTLGIQADVFNVSSCLEQNSQFNFSELTPKQCKQLLMEILKLNRYEKFADRIREEGKQFESQKFLLQNDFQNLKINLIEFEKLDTVIKNLEAICNATTQEIKDLEMANEKMIQAHNNSIRGLEEKLKTLQQDKFEQDKLLVEQDIKNVSYKEQINIVIQEKDKLQKRLDKFNSLNGVCPYCESDIDKYKIKKVKSELDIEYNNLTNMITRLQKEQSLQKVYDSNTSASKKLITQSLEDTEQDLIQTRKALLNYSSNFGINQLKQDLVKYETQLNEAKLKLSNKKKLEEQQAGIESTIKIFEEKIYDHTILLEVFGKNGIPSLIINDIVNEFEINTNKLLRQLTTKNLNVKMVLEKQLKTKEGLADTLDIVIKDSLIERSYYNYSGGEKFRINLAIRLALSQLLARRNNFKVETIIIDEPSYLDQEGLQSFKEMILNLQTMFKKILIVSHLSELIDDTGSFKVIEVKKDNHNVSYLLDKK